MLKKSYNIIMSIYILLSIIIGIIIGFNNAWYWGVLATPLSAFILGFLRGFIEK